MVTAKTGKSDADLTTDRTPKGLLKGDIQLFTRDATDRLLRQSLSLALSASRSDEYESLQNFRRLEKHYQIAPYCVALLLHWRGDYRGAKQKLEELSKRAPASRKGIASQFIEPTILFKFQALLRNKSGKIKDDVAEIVRRSCNTKTQLPKDRLGLLEDDSLVPAAWKQDYYFYRARYLFSATRRIPEAIELLKKLLAAKPAKAELLEKVIKAFYFSKNKKIAALVTHAFERIGKKHREHLTSYAVSAYLTIGNREQAGLLHLMHHTQ